MSDVQVGRSWEKNKVRDRTCSPISTSCVSSPAFSAKVFGTTNNAFANASTPSCARCRIEGKSARQEWQHSTKRSCIHAQGNTYLPLAQSSSQCSEGSQLLRPQTPPHPAETTGFLSTTYDKGELRTPGWNTSHLTANIAHQNQRLVFDCVLNRPQAISDSILNLGNRMIIWACADEQDNKKTCEQQDNAAMHQDNEKSCTSCVFTFRSITFNKNCARMWIFHILHKGVLLFTQHMLIDKPRIPEHLFCETFHRIYSFPTTGKNQPLHVPPLCSPQSNYLKDWFLVRSSAY